MSPGDRCTLGAFLDALPNTDNGLHERDTLTCHAHAESTGHAHIVGAPALRPRPGAARPSTWGGCR